MTARGRRLWVLGMTLWTFANLGTFFLVVALWRAGEASLASVRASGSQASYDVRASRELLDMVRVERVRAELVRQATAREAAATRRAGDKTWGRIRADQAKLVREREYLARVRDELQRVANVIQAERERQAGADREPRSAREEESHR